MPNLKKEPVIYPRSQHGISRTNIDKNALKVLYRLHNAGYEAFLVGGCVRDLLLNRHPKDFDIATNAHPEDIRKLFSNCRLIGKRFRLAHIFFGEKIIEVATFRTHHQNAHEQFGKTHEGMIIRDNVYGTIEDDVWRRDFSVNALYYNIADFSIVDYTGGMHDITSRTLRLIGEPEARFKEDPVRLLRAIRFLGKLNLNLTPEMEDAIMRYRHLLENVSSARLFQEVIKFFQEGASLNTFQLLRKYQLLSILFPATITSLKQKETEQFIEEALRTTDRRIVEDKTVSPAFLFAILLWHPIQHEASTLQKEGMPPPIAMEKGILYILKEQCNRLAIPRQLTIAVREICLLQHRLNFRHGTRAYRLYEHPRFRAALDLLLLRSHIGEPVTALCQWWMEFAAGTQEQRQELIKKLGKPPHRRPHRKKFKRNLPESREGMG